MYMPPSQSSISILLEDGGWGNGNVFIVLLLTIWQKYLRSSLLNETLVLFSNNTARSFNTLLNVFIYLFILYVIKC